jgi:hypothetical protein
MTCIHRDPVDQTLHGAFFLLHLIAENPDLTGIWDHQR